MLDICCLTEIICGGLLLGLSEHGFTVMKGESPTRRNDDLVTESHGSLTRITLRKKISIKSVKSVFGKR